jgi:hypothetical protein
MNAITAKRIAIGRFVLNSLLRNDRIFLKKFIGFFMPEDGEKHCKRLFVNISAFDSGLR